VCEDGSRHRESWCWADVKNVKRTQEMSDRNEVLEPTTSTGEFRQSQLKYWVSRATCEAVFDVLPSQFSCCVALARTCSKVSRQ
jgi:hypothetical protein